MLSDKEKKRRQHEKELKSLRNKMGKNIVWFDALNKTQQYDILFRWKKEKNSNKLKIPEKKIILKRVRNLTTTGYRKTNRWSFSWKKIEVISYPVNLRYFIQNIKPYFSVTVDNMRESQLNHLLNKYKISKK